MLALMATKKYRRFGLYVVTRQRTGGYFKVYSYVDELVMVLA